MRVLRRRPTAVPIVIVALSCAVILASLRLLLGSADWAGLGQWVGGLGAFAAAAVALSIARGELTERAKHERDRQRAHAHMITATWDLRVAKITNAGEAPVLDVQVIAIHSAPQVEAPLPSMHVNSEVKQVLIPGEQCGPGWSSISDPQPVNKTDNDVLSGRYVFEFTFRDLAGQTWYRVGDAAPTHERRTFDEPRDAP